MRVFVRFSPFAAERLTENAEDTWAEDVENGIAPARYGLSVIGDEVGSEVEKTLEVLCTETHLNGKKIGVLHELDLIEHGFQVVPDPTPREPKHCLVGRGNLSARFDATSLESLIRSGIRNNPRQKGIGA